MIQKPILKIELFHVPNCGCIYKLSKISGKYNRDISDKEYQKRLKDSVVFKRTDCNNETLHHV